MPSIYFNGESMLLDGFELMYIGMGAVFAFLLILVSIMNAMGWFFNKFDRLFPEEELETKPQKPISPMPKIAAAIALAYSQKNKK